MPENRFHDPENRLLLACFEASRAWFDGDESEKVQHDRVIPGKRLSEEEFLGFLNTWEVTRTSYKAERERLRTELVSFAAKYRSRDAIATTEFTKDLERLSAEQITKGRPISLVSKYLFCGSPEVFSPYDQHTLRALTALGAKVADSNYAQFLNAFDQFQSIVVGKLAAENLAEERFAFNGLVMEPALFKRRVTDKFLLLIGGYGDGRCCKLLKDKRCCFAEDVHQDFDRVVSL